MWPLSFFVHYMKSSFEELLRDLQIISKELFLSSWNTCISHKLKHSQIKQPHTLTEPSGKTNFGSPPAKPEDYLLLVTVRPPAGLSRRASTARLSAGFKQKGEPSFRKVPLFASILFPYEILLPGATSPPGARRVSLPSGDSAVRIMPADTSPRILRGARLATTHT